MFAWAPACQDSSHVGNAGVGVVSLRALLLCFLLLLLSLKYFFDLGKAVRCLLPLGAGRFMHLFVQVMSFVSETALHCTINLDDFVDIHILSVSTFPKQQPTTKGLVFWHFSAGRARHPGPPSQPRHVSLEFHNVGGWLTHGDLALEARVDSLAVVERGLIPARVRSEWARLKSKGLASIWPPASQDP